jgi:hypothetical protein
VPTKKSARLQREIDAVLKKRRASTRGRAKPKKSRASARKKTSAKQADILMVANDAALEGQYDRAEALLRQGDQRAIATAYKTTTPESAEEGDWADHGWEDEDGEDIEVTADEIEAEHEAGSHAPVSDAIAEVAAKWLRDHGAYETSSSSFYAGIWYSTPFEVSDYGTGEERSEDFFLRDFTEDEERRVFELFKRGRR